MQHHSRYLSLSTWVETDNVRDRYVILAFSGKISCLVFWYWCRLAVYFMKLYIIIICCRPEMTLCGRWDIKIQKLICIYHSLSFLVFRAF